MNSDFLDLYRKATKGKLRVAKLNERILTNQVSLALPKNSFISSVFNKKIILLVESGITQKLVKDFHNEYKIEVPEEEGPEVLSYEHLEVGFQAWLLLLLISSISLGIEVSFKLHINRRMFCLLFRVNFGNSEIK